MIVMDYLTETMQIPVVRA